MDPLQNSASTPVAHAFRRSLTLETSSSEHQSPRDIGHYALDCGPIETRAVSSPRLEFEEFISGISQALTNALHNQFSATIGACLKQIVEWFDTDRASLLEVDESTGAMVIRHQWLRSGFSCTKVLGVGTSSSSLERIRKGQMLFLTRLDGIPEEGADEIAPLASAGMKSAALIPLSVSNKLCGALSIASFRKHESWDERGVMRLRNVANILAGTLARRRAEERLHSVQAQIAEIMEPDRVEHGREREEIELSHEHTTVIGQSYEIRRVLRKAEQVAPTNSAVLILGETGTGKELIARTIHDLSQRNDRQMICVNCAAIPATLIESELFGREKGAYTGSLSREIGRFELADRSTIFLDEIGEMPLEVQAKLLRVLQDGEFERLGSSKTIHVNARVIAGYQPGPSSRRA
jgi:transcriptional regulator with GAF, ATPase, and Fis domain